MGEMFWGGIGLADDVHGILKGYLAIRATIIKQRDGRADGLEIQVADGIFELAEKRGKRGAVNMRLAAPPSWIASFS